jgi:hypothetical protein
MNEKPDMSSGLDEAALAARLKIAELASTDEFGTVNHSWLVLHIWLTQCDMVRSDQLRRNGKDMRSVNPSGSFLSGYKRMFSQVLPVVLPLMHEFADPEMFRIWREAGYFEEPADDPRFINRAHSAGLPICAEDLIYALGSDGPYGKDAFLTVAKQVHSARAH